MRADRNGPITDRLPLAIYAALVGFIVWFVIAAWAFAGAGYADFSLTVVTGLLSVVIAIPLVLWRVWRANTDECADDRPSLSEWKSCQFETWQDRVKGSNAAAEIILPIAAAAVGMTAFAIVFHFAAAHASVQSVVIAVP
jgi:hypothetical protein